MNLGYLITGMVVMSLTTYLIRVTPMVVFRKKITNEEVIFEDGCILINDKPGLGIDVCVEEVEKRPYHPINLRHYTGTLTDIRPKDDTIFYFKGIGDNV